jgi:hypothetical protein
MFYYFYYFMHLCFICLRQVFIIKLLILCRLESKN